MEEPSVDRRQSQEAEIQALEVRGVQGLVEVDALEEAAHAGVDGLFFHHLVLHKVTVQLARRVAFTADVLSRGGPEEEAEATEREKHLPQLKHEEELMLLFDWGECFPLFLRGMGMEERVLGR